jgi:hypothetical protein
VLSTTALCIKRQRINYYIQTSWKPISRTADACSVRESTSSSRRKTCQPDAVPQSPGNVSLFVGRGGALGGLARRCRGLSTGVRTPVQNSFPALSVRDRPAAEARVVLGEATFEKVRERGKGDDLRTGGSARPRGPRRPTQLSSEGRHSTGSGRGRQRLGVSPQASTR